MSTADLQMPPPDIPSRQPARERIRARLSYLYGEDRATGIERRIARLLQTHRQLRDHVTRGALWSHDDVVLITYGDSIQSTAQQPLQTLHTFLNDHLSDAFSVIHILPGAELFLDGAKIGDRKAII